mgnify:CR=1 FL=1
MNITNEELLSHVDHTLLKAYASYDDIKVICEDAIKYKTASVCIPPNYIARVHKDYPGLNICTVIGFPLGYSVKEAKIVEAKKAVEDGANEVDMVINITDVKNGLYDDIFKEIVDIKNAVKEKDFTKILKVIIETCYLNDDEKIKLCKIVTRAGADYIKTSTGFGTKGATHEDIKLFKENVGSDVKIKAAGGMSDLADMRQYLEEGADRLGTSRAVSIIKGA